FTPTIASVASAPPTTSGASSSVPGTPEEPRWSQLLAEGQALFSQHDLAGAQRKFKEAQDSGGGHAARGLLAQLEVIQRGSGPCSVGAISQPRLGLINNVARPSIAATTKGAVVAWTDDHEQAGHDHAYSVV